jgi:hypothetical protein
MRILDDSIGTGGGTRTPGTQVWKLLFWPLNYTRMVPPERLELS